MSSAYIPRRHDPVSSFRDLLIHATFFKPASVLVRGVVDVVKAESAVSCLVMEEAPASLPNVLARSTGGRRHAFPRLLRTGVLQEAPWPP